MGIVLYKGLSEQGLCPIPFVQLSVLQKSTSSSSSVGSSFVLPTSSAAFVGKVIHHSLWLKRFGHPTRDIVNNMLNKSKLPMTSTEASAVCEDFLLGKFKKLPFPVSQTKSAKPFEIVHSDVWGPSPYMSLDGDKYYVLFIDDCA